MSLRAHHLAELTTGGDDDLAGVYGAEIAGETNHSLRWWGQSPTPKDRVLAPREQALTGLNARLQLTLA
jgi:hypothetical protein